MKILIDNGHGLTTAGKRSPDGLFREAFYNREIAKPVVSDLRDRGLDAELLVPEDDDISLAERVRRVNAACFLLGKQNVSWLAFTRKRRWKRLKMAKCDRMECIHVFRGD